MANNRLFLKCKKCGERFFLGKYYPSTGWYTDADYYKNSAMHDKLNTWFDAHMHEYRDHLFGPLHFCIEFESKGVATRPKSGTVGKKTQQK